MERNKQANDFVSLQFFQDPTAVDMALSTGIQGQGQATIAPRLTHVHPPTVCRPRLSIVTYVEVCVATKATLCVVINLSAGGSSSKHGH